MKNLDKKVSLLTARTVNLFQKFPKENIFYLHIPKCGGTSLNNALQKCYFNWSLSDTNNIVNLDAPASWEAIEKSKNLGLKPDTVDDYQVMKFREELLLYHMSQRHIRFISGHFPFSSQAHDSFSSQYAFITILRNPVDRWISSYFYNRNRQNYQYRKIEMSIEEYLESDYGCSQGYEYAKFLAGVEEEGKYMTTQSINRAKENIHKFRLIGFLEDMKTFSIEFENIFGRKLNIGFLNQKSTSENSDLQIVLEKFQDKIKNICQPDIEIYEYAVNNFKKVIKKNTIDSFFKDKILLK